VAQGAAIQGDTLNETTSLTQATGILLLDVTPLSLAIETVGGVATRVVERNSTLPVHYSQVFTTAGMFQGSVEIHVLQGERPMAKDNKTIGKFKLKGIRKAMAGVPKIEVTFDIDVNGILTVSVRDQDTGANQSITITANEKMSEAEIQQAIRDAEQYAVQDGFRRDLMQTLNEAQMLCNQVTMALSKAGKQIDKEEKKRVKDDEAALRKLIARKPDKLTESDLVGIKAAMEQLRGSSIHVVQLAANIGENQ
jgi:molecular chaperone DnaK